MLMRRGYAILEGSDVDNGAEALYDTEGMTTALDLDCRWIGGWETMCIEGMGIAGVHISMDLNFPEEYQDSMS
jgi:hypothetical protein